MDTFEGWRPDPSAGWDPRPAAPADGHGGEIRLSLEGTDFTLRPGETARIGRSTDNDLVTGAPTVSRHHAVVRQGTGGWEFENTGSAATFRGGQQVTRVAVDQPVDLTLGSADGPVLHLEPAAAPAPAAPPAPAPATALDQQVIPQLAVPQPAAPHAPVPQPPVPQAPVSPAAGQPGPYTAGFDPDAFQPAAFAPGGYPPGAGQPRPFQTAAYPPGAGQPGPFQPGPYPPGAPVPPGAWPGGGWGPPPQPPPTPPGGLTGDDLATALRILFPIQSWLHDSGWRQGLRLLVIAYALLPLIFLALLSSSNDLSAPGWAYSLYIAPLWGMGFWMLIRPGRVTKREMQAGAGIIVFTLIWMQVVTIHINDALHLRGSISFFPALVIGYNEELTKALPLLLAGLVLLKYRSVKLDARMFMFLGTIAGLTFGVAEQAFYTSNDIIGINQAQSNNDAVTAALAFAERIFVDGFQHAVWAGISGFFIGMAINYSRRRIQLIVLGVSVSAVLHALNDALAGSSIWLVIVIQAASLLLFLGYTMSAASIEQRVRETPLFRGQSMLMPIIKDPAQPPPR